MPFGLAQQLRREEVMAKIGRNDPCPCKSGRKYKHCCIGKDKAKEEAPHQAPPSMENFKFVFGSYRKAGRFMPSLLIYREVQPDEWEVAGCLAKMDTLLDNEDAAATMAREQMVQAASAGSRVGDLMGAAVVLRARGYRTIEKFQVLPDDAEPSAQEGFKASEEQGLG